jgi:hypothetical protein
MISDPITEHEGYCKNAEKEDMKFFFFFIFSAIEVYVRKPYLNIKIG